ncbi:hypothetical protein DERP_005736 [Dermatophagoides pteronyssinus]|uniref:Uncharacterized protein n=1 Tax=Dermatophagoides pteronyssinus TaxID=6956 RepID=A0ABQ8JA15_DERPT|nr:hypothetical protein DERP_005736 [Dermatophagoides pteronyssinus]
MISVPDELKKKLTACRRSVSRLTDWRWDIERAEALRTELRSLNDELFDLIPENEDIPSEIEEKVEYYNVKLDRYINRLKSPVSSFSQFNDDDFEDSDDYVLSEVSTFIDIPRAHLSMLAQILKSVSYQSSDDESTIIDDNLPIAVRKPARIMKQPDRLGFPFSSIARNAIAAVSTGGPYPTFPNSSGTAFGPGSQFGYV